MSQKVPNLLAKLAVLLLLSGCQTVFDFSPPTVAHPVGSATSNADIVTSAGEYAAAYDRWSQWLANTPQILEVPIIGTGIAAAAELAYGKAHQGPVTSLALAGGGLALIDNYYAPRQRMLIYLAGSDAMRCVQSVAVGLGRGGSFQSLGTASATTFGALIANTSDPMAKLTFEMLAEVDAGSLQNLIDAIQQINTKIVTRASAASTQPDFSKIASDLKKAAKSDANLQHSTVLALQTLPGIAPNEIGMFFNTRAVITLTNFNTDLTACVLKAG